jgi:hypothetical protein
MRHLLGESRRLSSANVPFYVTICVFAGELDVCAAANPGILASLSAGLLRRKKSRRALVRNNKETQPFCLKAEMKQHKQSQDRTGMTVLSELLTPWL